MSQELLQALTAAKAGMNTPYVDGNPKTRYGMAKPSMSNVPPIGLMEVGAVMVLGAKKYGPMNWREDKVSASVYYNAMMRHLFAWWDGQDCDEESEQKHLAHVAACAMILVDAMWARQLNDDRPTVGEAPQYITANTNPITKET